MTTLVQEQDRVINCNVTTQTPFVDNLHVFPFDEARHFRFPSQNGRDQLTDNLLLHFVSICNVPFLQPQLALPAEEYHKLHLKHSSKFYTSTDVAHTSGIARGGGLGGSTPPHSHRSRFFHSRKVTAIKYYNVCLTTRRTINSHNLRKTNHLGRVVRLLAW